jgi:hypothetical protein
LTQHPLVSSIITDFDCLFFLVEGATDLRPERGKM